MKDKTPKRPDFGPFSPILLLIGPILLLIGGPGPPWPLSSLRLWDLRGRALQKASKSLKIFVATLDWKFTIGIVKHWMSWNIFYDIVFLSNLFLFSQQSLLFLLQPPCPKGLKKKFTWSDLCIFFDYCEMLESQIRLIFNPFTINQP